MKLPVTALLSLLVLATSSAAEGELTLSTAKPEKVVTISSEGDTDWAHWGRIHGVTILTRKKDAAPLIGNLLKLGVRELPTYENNPTTFNWSGGTPAADVRNTRSGVFTYGQNAGFQIELPADTTTRSVKVFCGVWRGHGKLDATLSDGSATASASHLAKEGEEGDNLVFTIRYRAATAGQKLTLKWINAANQGNVTWQAVAMTEHKP